MPLKFKIPGYAGNALLLLLGLAILFSGPRWVGVALSALAALNLYLVYKLDVFSREEVWLAHEIKLVKMREELLADLQCVKALEGDPNAALESVAGR